MVTTHKADTFEVTVKEGFIIHLRGLVTEMPVNFDVLVRCGIKEQVFDNPIAAEEAKQAVEAYLRANKQLHEPDAAPAPKATKKRGKR